MLCSHQSLEPKLICGVACFCQRFCERFCQISNLTVRSCTTVLSLCRLKSERQDPNHYLKRGEKDSIKAHGGSLTKRSPQPPKAGAYAARSNPPNTAFRRFYERGDLPIAVEHRGMKNVISWKVCRSYAVSMALEYTTNPVVKLPVEK